MESLQSAIPYRRGKLGSTRMSSRHGGDGKLDVRFEQPDKWRTGNHQSRDTLCSAESEWHWLGETGAGYRQARSIQTCAVAESNGVDWRATCRATTFPKLTYFRFAQINAWFIQGLFDYKLNETQYCPYKLDSHYKQLPYSSVARFIWFDMIHLGGLTGVKMN